MIRSVLEVSEVSGWRQEAGKRLNVTSAGIDAGCSRTTQHRGHSLA